MTSNTFCVPDMVQRMVKYFARLMIVELGDFYAGRRRREQGCKADKALHNFFKAVRSLLSGMCIPIC